MPPPPHRDINSRDPLHSSLLKPTCSGPDLAQAQAQVLALEHLHRNLVHDLALDLHQDRPEEGSQLKDVVTGHQASYYRTRAISAIPT